MRSILRAILKKKRIITKITLTDTSEIGDRVPEHFPSWIWFIYTQSERKLTELEWHSICGLVWDYRSQPDCNWTYEEITNIVEGLLLQLGFEPFEFDNEIDIDF